MTKKKDEDQKVADIRRDYNREELSKAAVADDPIEQFVKWFDKALAADLLDPNAMTLSTATKDGHPSSRIVLLKGVDERGFLFYTNYSSQKGKELAENPHAALCFYWAPLERQVRVEGTVQKIDKEESRAYFQQRPRLSQVGAWASKQSSKVKSRKELEGRVKEIKQKFEGQEVPLPDFWGGYILNPLRIEFWQGRKGRMHDRICYEREDNESEWDAFRLAP